MAEPKDEDQLGFDRAEFEPGRAPAEERKGDPEGAPPEEVSFVCGLCRAPVADRYFRANGTTLCPRCAEALAAQRRHGLPGALGRAIVFGVGGGVLGALLYFGVAAIANAEFGIIALVVGILVGKGVRKGAGLHQHWVYPALGLALTYSAIVATYVPQVLESFASELANPPDTLRPDWASTNVTAGRVVTAFLIALALPFVMLLRLEIWGPIILAIGLWEGHRYSKGPTLEVEGPFQRGAPQRS